MYCVVLYVGVYLCVCVCVFMCIYMCACVCMCVYYVCVCMCMYVGCVCVNVCLCVYVYVYTHTHTPYTSLGRHLCVDIVAWVLTSDCTEATKVDLGVSTVDIRALIFLIKRGNAPALTSMSECQPLTKAPHHCYTSNAEFSHVIMSAILIVFCQA